MSSRVLLKIGLMGDSAVGKTALRNRFLGEEFQADYLATIGADFALKEIKLGKFSVVLQVWDLAGQSAFHDVRSVYFLGSRGLVMVYDVTNRTSFNSIGNWIAEGWRSNKTPLPVVVAANKIDLRDEISDTITENEGQLKVKEISKVTEEQYGFPIKYYETSALKGDGVNELFEGLVNIIIDWLKIKKDQIL